MPGQCKMLVGNEIIATVWNEDVARRVCLIWIILLFCRSKNKIKLPSVAWFCAECSNQTRHFRLDFFLSFAVSMRARNSIYRPSVVLISTSAGNEYTNTSRDRICVTSLAKLMSAVSHFFAFFFVPFFDHRKWQKQKENELKRKNRWNKKRIEKYRTQTSQGHRTSWDNKERTQRTERRNNKKTVFFFFWLSSVFRCVWLSLARLVVTRLLQKVLYFFRRIFLASVNIKMHAAFFGSAKVLRVFSIFRLWKNRQDFMLLLLRDMRHHITKREWK